MKDAPEANGTPEPPVEELKSVEISGDDDATTKKIRNLSKKVRRSPSAMICAHAYS